MSSFISTLNTTVGRKYLMGITGLGMIGFAVLHLVGNLTLLIPDGGFAFNSYAVFLHSAGELTYLMELGLAGLFGTHLVLSWFIWWENRKGKPQKYAVQASARGVSRKNMSSTNMIWTGAVLGLFLVLHVSFFRFGAHWSIAEATTAELIEMAKIHPHAPDLAGYVITAFQQLPVAAFYMVVMCLLFWHLRHGFWSAFQSLGVLAPRFERQLRITGWVLAVLLGIGFLFLPLWIHLDPMDWYGELVRAEVVQ
jgi:succinate dehydrogenase / fumarate reductase, cytochrome b subunit